MGAGHGEERTRNIALMVVTLEVSKLSGWLNADVYCRESRKGGMRCGARYTRRQAGGGGRPRFTQRAGKRARLQMGAGHEEERTENILYMLVTLEVSKLSG